MRVRPAGLLDLSRIEEMHRSSEIKLSEAAPPAARLWSMLSSTLSALLPLAQDTLMYVADDGGKVVGFIQASGQPLALDDRAAAKREQGEEPLPLTGAKPWERLPMDPHV